MTSKKRLKGYFYRRRDCGTRNSIYCVYPPPGGAGDNAIWSSYLLALYLFITATKFQSKRKMYSFLKGWFQFKHCRDEVFECENILTERVATMRTFHLPLDTWRREMNCGTQHNVAKLYVYAFGATLPPLCVCSPLIFKAIKKLLSFYKKALMFPFIGKHFLDVYFQQKYFLKYIYSHSLPDVVFIVNQNILYRKIQWGKRLWRKYWI